MIDFIVFMLLFFDVLFVFVFGMLLIDCVDVVCEVVGCVFIG